MKDFNNRKVHERKVKELNRLRKKLTLKMKRHSKNIGKQVFKKN